MDHIDHISYTLNRPVFFRRNRVFRVYQGGKLFSDFMGDAPQDGNMPEEWICSSVHAINSGHTDPLEGISICEDGGVPFSELLKEHPKELLGDRTDIGVLVKYLDSAIRLPMQVHPTRSFSQKYFHSHYGKAEAWLILATRHGACIYFGFDRAITKEQFAQAVEQSEYDKNVMTEFVNKVPVQVGDVFFVDSGVIHAIGAGCFILEVQEPTDFTIQPEYWCGDYHLNEQEMYLGLEPTVALDCFDYGLFGEQTVQHGRRQPQITYQDSTLKKEVLIGPDDTMCFSMIRYSVTEGSMVLDVPASIWVCTAGSGKVRSDGYERSIHKGEYFFLPACASGLCTVQSEGMLELVCCVGGT